ncbi:UNVERIFIED_CONTAM: hypothetical protein K2H54_056191 [Gekko kuhli]
MLCLRCTLLLNEVAVATHFTAKDIAARLNDSAAFFTRQFVRAVTKISAEKNVLAKISLKWTRSLQGNMKAVEGLKFTVQFDNAFWQKISLVLRNVPIQMNVEVLS